MKFTSALIALSLAANLALALLLVRGRVTYTPSSPRETASARGLPAPPPAPRASSAPPSASATLTPAALRDRLQALGFGPEEVRAAVRAQIETPRRARQRAIFAEAAGAPWWHSETPSFALYNTGATGFTPQQTAELRQLLRAEREELVRTFGPGADIAPIERERFAFLPDEKATRVAAIERDYLELNRELTSGRASSGERAALEQQRDLLKASRERDLLAVLTPQEREEVELRTSNAAHSVARDAKYFSAPEADYRALYDSFRGEFAAREAIDRERLTDPGTRAGLDLSQRSDAERQQLLGPERYAEWQRSQRDDYRALVELQKRFTLPPATVAAVADVPRQISAEARRLTEDYRRPVEERVNTLRDLANQGRARVRALLGDDLGEAYNEASTRGWLDYLERGSIPVFQPNGRFVVHGVGSDPGLPARRNPVPPPPPAPKR